MERKGLTTFVLCWGVLYNDGMLKDEKIFGGYFRIRSDVYIDEGVMRLLTLFFGLFGVPNFITRRYLQGAVHLILFSLAVLGVPFFGGYSVSMPWGLILVMISYILAFLETRAYNRQVDELKVNSAEKSDKSFVVSGGASITLSLFVILFGAFGIWSSIVSLKQPRTNNAVLAALAVLFVIMAIIIPLFIGVYCCRKNSTWFKTNLLQLGRFTKKHKTLLGLTNVLFWCDIVIVTINVVMVVLFNM